MEKLQCILDADNLNITCEKDAFNVIKRWFSYGVSARQEQLSLLIASLRLTEFDRDFLLQHITPSAAHFQNLISLVNSFIFSEKGR